jgi:hypothetical protein
MLSSVVLPTSCISVTDCLETSSIFEFFFIFICVETNGCLSQNIVFCPYFAVIKQNLVHYMYM